MFGISQKKSLPVPTQIAKATDYWRGERSFGTLYRARRRFLGVNADEAFKEVVHMCAKGPIPTFRESGCMIQRNVTEYKYARESVDYVEYSFSVPHILRSHWPIVP